MIGVPVVDLSVPLNERTQTFPGDPTLRLTPHSIVAENGFNLLEVRMGSHTGTHVDAPYHVADDGPTLDRLPLSRFVGPAVLVDATDLGARDRILPAHLEGVLPRLGPGVIVLLHTGWSRHRDTPAYFEHPFLDATACRLLLDAGVRTIGIDAPSHDESPDGTHPGEGYPVHHLVADAQGVLCENLTNLASIDFPDPTVSLLPIALTGTDGAPVRAVAFGGR